MEKRDKSNFFIKEPAWLYIKRKKRCRAGQVGAREMQGVYGEIAGAL